MRLTCEVERGWLMQDVSHGRTFTSIAINWIDKKFPSVYSMI
jgi:hypothetical protein